MARPRSAILFETFVIAGLVALPAFFRALHGFLAPESMARGTDHPQLGFFSTVAEQLLLLALVWHIARLNGEGVGDFSEPIARRDVFRAFGLAFAGYVAYWAVFSTLHAAAPGFFSASERPQAVKLFQVPLSAGYLAWMVVNPHFEEITIRGFLQTRLRQAGFGATAIVLMSSLIQGAYHIYQGIPSAMALTASFCFWAAYYQKTRRLWPIVGAHWIMDLFAGLYHSRAA